MIIDVCRAGVVRCIFFFFFVCCFCAGGCINYCLEIYGERVSARELCCDDVIDWARAFVWSFGLFLFNERVEVFLERFPVDLNTLKRL